MNGESLVRKRFRPLLFLGGAFASLTVVACGSSATTTVTGPTAARCQASITNSSPSFGPAGGTGEVKIAVARECGWTASSPSPWVAITAGGEGQGDGTVTYRVNANADPIARKAAIVIGEQHADVAQDPAPCRYTISAPSAPLPGTGGTAVVDLRTHSACNWTASADAAWVTLNPSSGHGDTSIRIEAGPNTGSDRAATLTIGDDRVVVHQTPAPVTPGPTPVPPTTPTPTPTPTPAPTPPPPTPTPTPTPPPPTPTPTPPPPTPTPTPPPPAPTPTPTPPPPPPPPPPVETITLVGKVDNVRGSCPQLSFDLKGFAVRTTSATAFERGPCKDLRDGKDVTVFGEVKEKSVTALRLEFKK